MALKYLSLVMVRELLASLQGKIVFLILYLNGRFESS